MITRLIESVAGRLYFFFEDLEPFDRKESLILVSIIIQLTLLLTLIIKL